MAQQDTSLLNEEYNPSFTNQAGNIDFDWWAIEHSTNDVASDIATAVGSDDSVHVAYFDDVNDNIKYAYFDGVNWANETVWTHGEVGGKTLIADLDIALDSNNFPFISFRDNPGAHYLQISERQNGYWQNYSGSGIGSPMGGFENTIIIDSNDDLHLIHDSEVGDILYEFSSLTSSNTRTCPKQTTFSGIGHMTSLAVLSNGTPIFLYKNPSNSGLNLATCSNNGQWVSEPITGDNANNFFIGLDSLDNPVISYTVGTINGEILKFAKFNQSTNSWQSIILDSGSPTNGLRGYGPTSITVNQEDDISVIYYSGNRVNIISQQNGIWQTPYFIDAPTAGDAGRHISADIDSYGMPRISYQANLDPFGFGLHHIRLLPDFRIDSISPNNAEAGNTVQVSVTGDGFDMLPKYTRDIDITNDFDFSVQDYSIFVENPLFDESSLVGSYHLDDANELDVTDSSGWDNTGSGTPFSYVDNGYGKALDLDGIDDYVYFSDINIANTSSDEFTLCGWWNWDVYPGQGGTLLFSNRQHNTPTSTGIDVSVKPGLGGIKLRTTSDSDVQSSVDFGVGMSTGTWYHICVISEASNSGDYKVSFNGAIDPSDVVSKSGLQSWTQSGGYLELGGYGSFLGTQYTDAQVDEIKIYERALTDQEISDIFNSTFRADYGDVRFWDSDGNSLEYEMLSDGNFMINIPSMSALETRTIHMTYGALGLDSESQLLDEWPSNNSSTTITPLISYDFEDSYAVNPPPSQSTCYNLVNDSSGNQNHGTVYGNENQCGVNGFDGDGIKLLEASNDYIEIDSGDWQNSSVATVSYHVNLTGFTHTGGQVVGFSSDEFYNNGIRAGISLGITSNGNVECQVGDSVSNTAPSIVTTNLSLTTGVWYHLLCSWDNITLRLYVDGLLSHTHTPTPGSFNGMSWGPGFSGPGPALLGKYSTHFTGSNTMYTAYSDALYDNFAYFDYAVPDEVIAELFSTQNLWPLTINNYGIIGVENLHNYGITLENSVSIAIQTTSVSIINSTTINFTIPPASYSSGFYDVVLADVFGNELYRFTNGFEFTAPPDTDGDGWANDIDAFPLDSSQWLDGDGDGYGDNASGNNSDAFPNDSTQWQDSDGDGYGDNLTGNNPDAFPLDPSADTDTDGDGDPDTLNPPSNSVPPLVEDLDDDGDGLDDVNETNTGIFNGPTDTGTDPLNPDSDNDGICDGPIDVLPICVATSNANSSSASDMFGFQEGSIFTDTTLSSSESHTCAILDNGSVACWGRNDKGQLGDGTTIDRNTPVQTSSLGNGRTAIALTTGPDQTCAILDNGSVSCWGNSYIAYGPNPTQISSLGLGRTAVAISASQDHTCAILDDGSVRCWGRNAQGQLGDGTNSPSANPIQTSSLGTGRTAIAISTGGQFTCVILDDGSVSCWGDNYNGALGDGTSTTRNTPALTSSLGTGRTAVAISSGYGHTCVILDNGSVSCWGDNYNGALGDGTLINHRKTPALTSSLGTGRTAVSISVGGHACVILDDGNVSCWGSNYEGQLGNGNTTNRNTPVQTSSFGPGRTVVGLASGSDHTCSILDNRSVSCWGHNDHGRLGDGTSTSRSTPAQTSSLGVNRTAALSERDLDGDGILNIFDSTPYPPIPDTDGDGWTDDVDAFPNDSTQWLDGDGDGYGDNSTGSQPDDCVTVWGNSTIGQLGCPDNDGDGLSNTEDDCPDSNNSIGSTDTDGDGCLDAEDAFPDDNTEHEDSDGDGIGDNSDPEPEVPLDSDGDGYPDLQGYLNSDDCPEVWGNSTGQLVGCLDADGDGLADSIDAFPSDADRTYDEDMDGYDDLIEDDCPDTGGNSTIDLLGCVDSDGDGVSDINDLFPNDSTDWNDDDGDGVGNNSDAFPQDANETIDSDGDGVGDNGDLFPQDSNESIDSDGDGIGDNEDQYPLQDNFIDTDNDGIFDVEDVFPTDPTQWQDADNDGYGDNLTGLLADLFPSDDSQWADLDNDGYGDNWGNETWNQTRLFIWPGMFIDNASNADHCPDTWGNSSADGYFGCPDLDGDTIADIYDDEIDLESENNQTQQSDDADNDGVADLFDFCPNSKPGAIVDSEGCLIDQDNDGVGDSTDQCPNTNPDSEVNIEGCAVDLDDEPEGLIEEILAGDTGAIAKTVGIGAVIIAVIGFMQTNFIAAMLPDAFRWVQVFRNKSKLSAEEEMELGHLQSVVQTYFNDVDELKEELFNLKSDLTARFTNGEIKPDTRKLIFTLISDLLAMESPELKRVANDDRFFGLAGTTNTKERSEMIEIERAMRGFEEGTDSVELDSFGSDYLDKNSPTPETEGVVNEEDGHEYIEHPPDSGRWFIRNTRTNMWDEWKD
ncbi:hypothetical protein N9K60_02030 [Candidatus Poseidoniales archaeon]|nr:hypothetical protein [Candidatus Poseidoniales archaeon]